MSCGKTCPYTAPRGFLPLNLAPLGGLVFLNQPTGGFRRTDINLAAADKSSVSPFVRSDTTEVARILKTCR